MIVFFVMVFLRLVCLFCCVSRLVVLFGGDFMLDSVSRCCFVDIGYWLRLGWVGGYAVVFGLLCIAGWLRR